MVLSVYDWHIFTYQGAIRILTNIEMYYCTYCHFVMYRSPMYDAPCLLLPICLGSLCSGLGCFFVFFLIASQLSINQDTLSLSSFRIHYSTSSFRIIPPRPAFPLRKLHTCFLLITFTHYFNCTLNVVAIAVAVVAIATRRSRRYCRPIHLSTAPLPIRKF